MLSVLLRKHRRLARGRGVRRQLRKRNVKSGSFDIDREGRRASDVTVVDTEAIIGQLYAIFGADGRPVICPERAVRAEEAEATVLRAVAQLALPDEAIQEARDELRRRLQAPWSSIADKERARLRQRIENLRKQHEWGDISDIEYRARRTDAEAQLAGMPDHDKLALFDRQREILLSMAENIERATPPQLGELIGHLVERVETASKRVTLVVWTAPARPFFVGPEVMADGSGALFWCPQGDSNP